MAPEENWVPNVFAAGWSKAGARLLIFVRLYNRVMKIEKIRSPHFCKSLF